ncbi:MAG: hypothetical protein LBH70_01000 [Spirochaetaceae bacterium]|jgi:hypothetical protein|nr:hypothetical protein [Spirochaetaceae bacterium]
MEKFWSVFWRAFGTAILVAFVIGIIAGLVSRSPEVTYSVVQKTLAVGLGVCGFIGFGVVPATMYFEDRSTKGEAEDAPK